VEEGLRVEQGQVLARLDDAEAARALALSEAQLGSAGARWPRSKRRARARPRDFERQRSGWSPTKFRSEAELDAARAERDALDGRPGSDAATGGVARRAVAVERQNLENTVIRAPFAGVRESRRTPSPAR